MDYSGKNSLIEIFSKGAYRVVELPSFIFNGNLSKRSSKLHEDWDEDMVDFRWKGRENGKGLAWYLKTVNLPKGGVNVALAN